MNRKGIKNFKGIIILAIFQLITMFGVAQDFNLPEEAKSGDTVRLDTIIFESFNIRMNLRNQMISLDSIVSLALQNHPQIKFQGALVDKSEHNLKHVKRLWTNNIYGFTNYTWGDQTILLNSNIGESQNNNLTTGYQAGAGFRIPLYEFYGRQARVNQAKAELEASEYQKQVFEQTIKMQVIQEYFNLLTAQELMIIASESFETQDLNSKIAEKELLKGQMKMSTFSQVHKTSSDVREKFEVRKQEFYTAFYRFEQLVGVKMIDLKKQQKK